MMDSIVNMASHYVMNKFNNSPPAGIIYHNLRHTKDVVHSANRIAKFSRISRDQLELLLLAAWFHDIGILDQYRNHEARSAVICSNFLKQHNYPLEKIKKIVQLIRSTKIPQKPTNLLERILCDADLSHIGKKGFNSRSMLLRYEWERMIGKKFSEYEWIKTNFNFIKENKFRTFYAKSYFNEGRKKNLLKLREKLKNYKITPPPKHKSLS